MEFTELTNLTEKECELITKLLAHMTGETVEQIIIKNGLKLDVTETDNALLRLYGFLSDSFGEEDGEY